MKRILFLITIAMIVNFSYGQTEIKLISWNIESGGISLDTITSQLKSFSDIALFGLCEVPQDSESKILNSMNNKSNSNYKGIFSQLRGNDRLMILYDSNKFKLLESIELTEIALVTMRPALIGFFQEISTNQKFYFIVVHLARNPEYLRYAQSRALKMWINKNKKVPVIVVGDFNYDWNVNNGDNDHDKGYDILTNLDMNDQSLFWLKPKTIITTQCSDRNNDQKCDYNSVLDFIFINEAGKKLNGKSEIIVRHGDFPDDDFTSDHRPVEGNFTFK